MMKKWDYKTAGISDDLFIRANVPMSKEEIRAVIISKLRLKNKHIVYDIGAGTGSVSIEIAQQAKEGRVYAIERKKEAIDLIVKNTKEFELENIKIIEGNAPEKLSDLPSPDRVFVGGSDGQLANILKGVDNKIKSDGRIVVTAVTINTLNLAIKTFEKLNYELNISNIAVTRTKKVNDYHMFKALNPIYIISANRNRR
ncbi:MAG: precorrin-6Y C5,15-methyltransferase (decarboxylating) subunit CbiT [Halanaerobiales bacterium]